MLWRIGMVSLGFCVLLAGSVAGKPDPTIAPVKEIKGIAPTKVSLANAAWGKPIVIQTADEAAKHFDGEALAALKKQVDFKQQIVLVFAWKGSGQDRVDVMVAESFPEQAFFSLLPGKTRDLRDHVSVYSLRSNVRWSVRNKR